MEVEKQYQNQQKKELSPRVLILEMLKWWHYLLSKWVIILVFGLLGGALGLTYAFFAKPKYIGELTFVLEDSKSNSLSAYMGLASQFGIDLSGGTGGGVFEGDNILEFLRSRLMVEATLLSPIETEGKKETMADLYITFNKLRKKWEKDTLLKELHFPLGQPRATFTRLQDSVLYTIQKSLLEKNIEIRKPDKKLNFVAVKCTSLHEKFSKMFVEQLVTQATDFYVKTKTKRSKANVDRLQVIADSLETLLNRKTYSLAVTKDINQNPARQVAGVQAEVETRDKMVLQTMYGEVIKNLELSKITMEQETPIVQIVDTPILPLSKKKTGKAMGLIMGGFLGGFLIVSFLLARRLYMQMMEEE